MDTQKTLSKREQILLAACEVVQAEGVAHLTLESAAQKAGVSKGGLLYHFPNKEALVTGMMDWYLEGFEARVQREYDADADASPIGRWLRAFVRASFAETPLDIVLISAALAVVAHDPALLDRFQVAYQSWKARALTDGLSSQTVILAMSATDGIWYAEMMGIQPHTAHERQALLEDLLGLIAG